MGALLILVLITVPLSWKALQGHFTVNKTEVTAPGNWRWLYHVKMCIAICTSRPIQCLFEI